LLVDTAVELVSLAAETILDNLPKIIEAGIDLLDALIEGIVNNLPALIQQALELVIRISGEIIKNLPKIIEAGIEIILALIDGLIRTIPDLVKALPQIIDAIFDTFSDVDWLQIGKDIIQGLIDGIGSMASAVWSKVREIAGGIKDSIMDALGMHSPSRVMMDIGIDTGKGMEIGLEKSMRGIMRKAEQLAMAAVPGIHTPATAGALTTQANIQSIADRGLQQPAVIRLVLGRREFETYVDDITEVQDRKSYRLERFRG